ncbi:MAG: D-alanine--D-alanine ligase family protein [Microthrixaceae bacterium]
MSDTGRTSDIRHATALPDRVRLVVLFGGQSAEHDISCISASNIVRALDVDRYDIEPIGIDRDGCWHRAESAAALLAGARADFPDALSIDGPETTREQEIVAAASEDVPTVVFPVLHGPNGEDGTVQGLLELLDVPFVGSGVLGSAVCMDKVMAKTVLDAAGIPQARWRSLHRDESRAPDVLAGILGELGETVFVKPANMGSSIGITRATGADELAAAVDVALRYDDLLVIEEALSVRELETAVLGSTSRPRVSVVGEIVPAAEFYDFDDKYTDGAAQTVIPADLSEELSRDARDLALRTFTTLRAEGLARVDLFLAEGRGLLVNEVNTLPGFTPISMYPMLWAASGLPYGELLDELVALALERHAARARLR